VYEALSYADALNPWLSLVFVFFLADSNQGSATLKCIYFILAAICAGLLSTSATYIAWAANGNSFSNTPVKAVVFTIAFSVFVGALNALRWKHDITNMFFLLFAVTMVFSGGVSTYSLSYVAWKGPFYALAYASMSSASIFLASWFVFPITTATTYRRMIRKAVHGAADALATIETTLFSPINRVSGHLADAQGHADLCTGTDIGLLERVALLKGSLRESRTALQSCSDLHVAVVLELDVYNKLRIFPRQVDQHVSIIYTFFFFFFFLKSLSAKQVILRRLNLII